MSFFEKLGLGVIKNEKDMLLAMRNASEQWYNELTSPFLPILTNELNSSLPTHNERQKLAKLANDMMCAEHLINNGNALENKLAEIEQSSGIPLFSSRKELREKVTNYLDSGIFLKKFAYGSFKTAETSQEYRAAVEAAKEKWEDFREKKEALVTQINKQLARIG